MTSSLLPRVLLLAGAAAWIGVNIATLTTTEPGWRLLVWTAPSLIFIASFAWNARRQKSSLVALSIQSVSVVTMVALLCNGYEGLLMVLVAAQLALHGDKRIGTMWIVAQSLALAVAIACHWSPRPALVLTPPYLGFQILMFVAIQLQSELAAKTRAEERLRIAQDMHDVLGHRLTALNLNLELAVHESADTARTTLNTAQALARALLRDIKTLVRSASDEAAVDLHRELQQLAQELPRPQLHISCSPDLASLDARISRALFRAVQEIVTNAIRHGEARNLWIGIEYASDHVRLVARDDGRAVAAAEGFGLSGMRRRLEELGGTLSAAPTAAGGFEVRVDLPFRREAVA